MFATSILTSFHQQGCRYLNSFEHNFFHFSLLLFRSTGDVPSLQKLKEQCSTVEKNLAKRMEAFRELEEVVNDTFPLCVCVCVCVCVCYLYLKICVHADLHVNAHDGDSGCVVLYHFIELFKFHFQHVLVLSAVQNVCYVNAGMLVYILWFLWVFVVHSRHSVFKKFCL